MGERHWASGDFEAMPIPLQEAIKRAEPIVVDDETDGSGSQKIIHGPKDIYHLDHQKHGTCTTGRVFCVRHFSLSHFLATFCSSYCSVLGILHRVWLRHSVAVNSVVRE